ncbi:glycosyltransferase family 4 protein [Luteococcus sp. Sow4_B9]|uniref:glycosyltransferase family 4 protein n=1 Tax=Luteococcus sp. Sow4_B9 TaxID=3438792 RepID=UPI003F99F2F2
MMAPEEIFEQVPQQPAGRVTSVAYVCVDPGIPVFGTKGASVHIQELVRAWRERGAHVHVYCARRGDDVPSDLADLEVTEVKVRGKGAEREPGQKQASQQIAELVKAGGHDLVHERYSLFSQVMAQVRSAQPDLPTVLEVNSPLIDEQRTHRELIDVQGTYTALARQLDAADVVACVSEPVAQWVRDRAAEAGAEPGAVVVTPNGVNTNRITAVEPDLSGPGVVVFVGTLKPWHGTEHLFTAATLAREPWRLRIVGDGPQREQLEALAAEHQLDVEMVGAVAPQDVPGHLAGALVAVAPYPASDDHYFSPLKVYEYSAAGLPVVASRIGEIPQVVLDGQTGVLVPPSDPAALAAAIDALVARPERARQLGRAGRDLMERQHSWAHVLAATLAPLEGRL